MLSLTCAKTDYKRVCYYLNTLNYHEKTPKAAPKVGLGWFKL